MRVAHLGICHVFDNVNVLNSSRTTWLIQTRTTVALGSHWNECYFLMRESHGAAI